MKFIDRSQVLAIILTVTLFVAFLGALIGQQERLYGYQPYVQKFFTDHGESDRLFNQRVEIHSGEFVLPYTSLLRTTTFILSEGGSVPSDLLFQYGAVFLRALYVILVMMIVMTMTHRVQYALVSGLIIFTSPFFVVQSPSLIPENVAVLFFLLMIWGFEKYKRTGRIVFMLVVILAMVANIAYDPTSVVMNGIIVLGYALVFLFSEALRKIEVTFFSVLIALILMIPMFGTLLNIISTTYFSFGDNTRWIQYAGENALAPTVNTFFEIIGYPVTIFSILGIVAIVRRRVRQYLHLLVMLACIVLLMVNVSPSLTLNPGRMQTYLYIVLLLISGVYVSLLFSRTSRLIRMMLIAVFVSYSIATFLTNPLWARLTDEEVEIAQIVNAFLIDNPDHIVFVDADGMRLSVLIEHPDQLCAFWEPIYQWYVPPASGDIPNCNGAEYRIAEIGLSLPEYRIVQQTNDIALYQRIVDV